MTSAKSNPPTDNVDLPEQAQTQDGSSVESEQFEPPTEVNTSGGSDSPATATGEAGEGEAPDELEMLRAQVAQLQDETLRARADADNARKRAQGEIVNARRFALEGFAGELLTVRDSLGLARAVDLTGGDNLVEQMAEGLELTLKQLDATFERFSVFEVSPEVGDKLDPESHQAMSLVESTDVAPNHICQVVQKGYRLHDRLLRPAMVIVAKAPADS
ncbi:MAG: nucleotide exchange factor GrpE [Arenicellales bacterium]